MIDDEITRKIEAPKKHDRPNCRCNEYRSYGTLPTTDPNWETRQKDIKIETQQLFFAIVILSLLTMIWMLPI